MLQEKLDDIDMAFCSRKHQRTSVKVIKTNLRLAQKHPDDIGMALFGSDTECCMPIRNNRLVDICSRLEQPFDNIWLVIRGSNHKGVFALGDRHVKMNFRMPLKQLDNLDMPSEASTH